MVAKIFIPPVGSVESLNPFSSEKIKKEKAMIKGIEIYS